MDKSPRILICLQEDVGGCMHALARYMRQQNAADIRVLALQPSIATNFPAPYLSAAAVDPLAHELVLVADVLHFVDVAPDRVAAVLESHGRQDASVRIQLDGRLTEAATTNLIKMARTADWPIVTTRPAIALRFGVAFAASFIPYWEANYRPLFGDTRTRESLQRPIVVFASSRIPIERRPLLEEALDNAQDLTTEDMVFEIIVAAAHRSVLRRRRSAHLCIAPHNTPLSLSALEGLAQGVPVYTQLPDDVRALYAREAGHAPPIVAPEKLAEVLSELHPRTAPCADSREWAIKFLSVKKQEQFWTAFWRDELPQIVDRVS